ncbi:GNAT family N-acetyltransferase [Shewanella sp. YIC-542]|uniref:GNAT family N-acetyltransferase n=1 Tax=Shewanella mytili TaxID=3377111 RepID=UPI00398F6F68
MINIRTYKGSDARALWAIFYYAVRKVNLRDYSQAQVEAWAPDDFAPDIWQRKMNEIEPFIAEIDGEIVGYADLQENGLIDHFFVHHEHQGQGVGRRLMEHVLDTGKRQGNCKLYSEVSITARPFFEKFGFNVVQAQTVDVRGQKLRNFLMEKRSL